MSAADLMGLAGAPPPGAPPSIQVQGEPPPPGPGGPPSPTGAMAGLPPDLAGLLGPGGPEEDGGDLPTDEVGALEDIRERMLHYIDIASDDIEKSQMTNALNTVQKLLAKNQQETEAASGTTPAMKGMRKAIQAGA